MGLLFWIEKAVKLSIGLAITLVFLQAIASWEGESKGFFLFTGRLDDAIVVIIIAGIATFLIEKLWKWEIHDVLKPQRRRPLWTRR